MPLRLKEVHRSLKRRIQRFSAQDQADDRDQNQPFNRGYPEIAAETDCSRPGKQMDPEIPLSQAEQE